MSSVSAESPTKLSRSIQYSSWKFYWKFLSSFLKYMLLIFKKSPLHFYRFFPNTLLKSLKILCKYISHFLKMSFKNFLNFFIHFSIIPSIQYISQKFSWKFLSSFLKYMLLFSKNLRYTSSDFFLTPFWNNSKFYVNISHIS